MVKIFIKLLQKANKKRSRRRGAPFSILSVFRPEIQLRFLSVQQPHNIRMMTYDNKNRNKHGKIKDRAEPALRPQDIAQKIHANGQRSSCKQRAQRNVSGNNNRDQENRESDKRRKRRNHEHDGKCGKDAFSAPESKIQGPGMSDDCESARDTGAVQALRCKDSKEQPSDHHCDDSFAEIAQEGKKRRLFPVNPLHVGHSRIAAPLQADIFFIKKLR